MAQRGGIRDIIFSTALSVFFSVALVFLFALIVKWLQLDFTAVNVGNTVIRLLSVFFGILLGFKSMNSGAVKGAVSGLLYALLSSLVFSLYAGVGLFEGIKLTSVLFGIISGAISGIIVVNIRK